MFSEHIICRPVRTGIVGWKIYFIILCLCFSLSLCFTPVLFLHPLLSPCLCMFICTYWRRITSRSCHFLGAHALLDLHAAYLLIAYVHLTRALLAGFHKGLKPCYYDNEYPVKNNNGDTLVALYYVAHHLTRTFSLSLSLSLCEPFT